jgi:hypothetical protein
MDMFGGLTKTSSRIAIAAALGLTLGGFAFKATPAQAADLGGDCCADLEERVAELEATTVRKGNKKVSVTISGWVVKSMNFWDDGDIDHFVVGDKDYDLGSRFAITGSATISPGWSAGYNLTVNTWGATFGTGSNQINDLGTAVGGQNDFGAIATLYSYIYIKSDTLGTLNWGTLSPASDNPAVLADISGTVIETNGVWFEGPGFFLRPKGGGKSLSGLAWGDFLRCQGLGAGIGVDCWGVAQPAVRYDSPTWGGFRFETSYGKNQVTGDVGTPDTDFWDIAVFYTADWNSIKVSAAAAYTWIETGALTGRETDLYQAGGSIMHKPSGLGVYAMGQWEESGGANTSAFGLSSVALDSIGVGIPVFPAININLGVDFVGGNPNVSFSVNNPDTDAWYIKPFWRKAWSPIGATVLYGEYGQYNDQFAAGTNLCSNLGTQASGGALGAFCAPTALSTGDIFGGALAPLTLSINATSFPGDIYKGAFVTGSEAQRWGLGVVQEIDSAAMHLWARWQHQELETDIVGVQVRNNGFGPAGSALVCSLIDIANTCSTKTKRINQQWDDWDLFQFGGIIFF